MQFQNQISKYLHVIFLLLGGISSLVAQREDNIWLLGFQHFLGGTDTLFGNSIISFTDTSIHVQKRKDFIMKMNHTNASICDSAGNLLFYTNGLDIYNKRYLLMAGGANINPGDLHDGFSDLGYPLLQGAIILPWPNKKNIYTIFHAIETLEDDTFYTSQNLLYSVVDMSKLGGLGFATAKNEIFFTKKMTAVSSFVSTRHANGRDWWLIFPEWNSPIMHRFLFDPTGIHYIGQQTLDYTIYSLHGQSNFSPDGTKFARISFTDFHYYELHFMDFDRCTGLLSNHHYYTYPETNSILGGCCFSSNSRFLYLAIGAQVIQIDLNDPSTYARGEVILNTDNFGTPFVFTYDYLVNAPDGKIYFASSWEAFVLNTIHEPNKKSSACNIKAHDLMITYNFGMPNYPNFRLKALRGSICDTIGKLTQIDDTQSDEDLLQVYPNPAKEKIIFDFTNSGNEGIIEVHDISGRLIHSVNISKQLVTYSMDVSMLDPAIYIYRYIDSQHRTMINGKFQILR